MKVPFLKIGDAIADQPIIQGGMAVGVSTSELAVTVAEEGGIGVIGATGLSMDDLRRQMREARAMTKGLLGLNVMVAARQLEMGAAGVQLGTRFLLSDECTVHKNFKDLLINSKASDLVRIMSPVGLPANAILTPLVKKYLSGDNSIRPKSCDACLKKCGQQFCILEALQRARNGDYERGLFFTGKRYVDINAVEPVKKIFSDLLQETQDYLERVLDKETPTPTGAD